MHSVGYYVAVKNCGYENSVATQKNTSGITFIAVTMADIYRRTAGCLPEAGSLSGNSPSRLFCPLM